MSGPEVVDREGNVNPYALGVVLGELGEKVSTVGREVKTIKGILYTLLIAIVVQIARGL